MASQSPAVAILMRPISDICCDIVKCEPNPLPPCTGWCCMYRDIAEAFEIDSPTHWCCMTCWFGEWATCMLRDRIQAKLGMTQESCCNNFMVHRFCPWCALRQEYQAAMAHKQWKQQGGGGGMAQPAMAR